MGSFDLSFAVLFNNSMFNIDSLPNIQDIWGESYYFSTGDYDGDIESPDSKWLELIERW